MNAQLLNRGHSLPSGKAGALAAIEHLGYIQIDTIHVIARAHHHVLWTRLPDYDPEMLHELQAEDRAVFEYWGHAMSYLPMEDFRYALPRMRNFQNPQHPWFKEKFDQTLKIVDDVKKRVHEEGPLTAKDFEHDKKGGVWWNWKPAKIALELLFWRGELMISERRKFQKVYDLTERVLPDHIDTTMPEPDETARFLVRRAVQSLGAATQAEILKFMQPGTARDSDMQAVGRKEMKQALKELTESEEIVSVDVDGSGYFTSPPQLETADTTNESIHLLSPFDNLVIQRERIKKLFDFDYTLECYVPAAKRRFGYFVHPVLWKGNLVGRLDPKADRQRKVMMLQRLEWETGFTPDDDFLTALAAKLKMMAFFNACPEWEVHDAPPEVAAVLKDSL